MEQLLRVFGSWKSQSKEAKESFPETARQARRRQIVSAAKRQGARPSRAGPVRARKVSVRGSTQESETTSHWNTARSASRRSLGPFALAAALRTQDTGRGWARLRPNWCCIRAGGQQGQNANPEDGKRAREIASRPDTALNYHWPRRQSEETVTRAERVFAAKSHGQ